MAFAYLDDLNVTEPKDIMLEEFLLQCFVSKIMAFVAVLFIYFALIYQCIGS